jgi:membrane glycosyltransferase
VSAPGGKVVPGPWRPAGGGGEPPDRTLEVRADRIAQDWAAAQRRAEAYLEALGFDGSTRTELARRAVESAVARPAWENTDAVAETMSVLREILFGEGDAASSVAEQVFLLRRIEASRGAPPGSPLPAEGGAQRPPTSRPEWIRSMPPLQRANFVAHRLERHGLRRRIVRASPGPEPAAAPGAEPNEVPRARRRRLPGVWVARRRRALLAILVVAPSIVAAGFMTSVLPHKGDTPLELAIAIFFGALFAWISIGFWTAVLGFLLLLRRRDRFSIDASVAPDAPIGPETRTAIVMPICEEPVDRVFAGLKAIYHSLERAGALEHFELFVLSDSADPSRWVQEEEAWFEWCRREAGFDRVYYRRRHARVARKSGNVADFCRRWGRRFKYMIVLDADSVMTGAALIRLVRLMEAHPEAGVIQTVPVALGRSSLFARIQQFSSRLYGPIFSAGLHFWQLGDGQYWGHNAILRVKPFMDHCGLPRLPGRPPLGGEIMSHDFVEAALLGRAGYSLWLAYDLPGSYEETPSSLLEEMQRDRRWCQGNLQHLRLLTIEGLFGAHRALFLNGVLSYVSAFAWFCFLALSTSEAVWEAIREPDYFPSGRSLFPEWPVWSLDRALWLAAGTGVILFLPKIIAALRVLMRGSERRAYGGAFRFLASLATEFLASAIFAPIRMVFHTRFLVLTALGSTVGWRSPKRSEGGTTWGDAIRYHWVDTVVASAWGLTVFYINPNYFWWLTPIVVALVLSVPLSVLASRVRFGDRLRRIGLLRVPEETSPPPEIAELLATVETDEATRAALPPLRRDGFVRAVVDPTTSALHRALRGVRRSLKPSIRDERSALVAKALARGPDALTASEKRVLLSDADLMGILHRRVWQLADDPQAARWGIPT